MGSPLSESAGRELPIWVDRFKPMGMSAADFSIQVDHVHPHSRGGGGGGENLRLSCGWCNAAKGGKLGLYDGSLRPRTVVGGNGALLSSPRPLGSVRLLALRGRCEYPSGCDCATSGAELSVGLRYPDGAAVPQNLLVLCERHNQHPDRFVMRAAMTKAQDARYI